MKLVLRLIGVAGVLLFGVAFALTFASPVHFERAGKEFIQSKLEEQVRERVDFRGSERLAAVAMRLQQQNSEQIAEIQQRLASGLNARIAAVVASMQDLSCECRTRMRHGLDTAARLQIANFERAEPQLRRLIEGRYGEIVANLLRDLRIFTGTNLLAFALLVLLSLLKPQHVRQLFVPGVLLAVASLIASGIYLFGQNWFFTLLYNDFVGGAYAAWLMLIYALLCDVALFEARVTGWIVDAVLSVVGKAASAAPC